MSDIGEDAAPSPRAQRGGGGEGSPSPLLVVPERATELIGQSADWPSWDLTRRQFCDLELLLNGGFAPLSGFLERPDYLAVRDTMRLAGGQVWPIPVCLGVNAETATAASATGRLVLRQADGKILAVMEVRDAWQPDRVAEAEAVFGTASKEHEGVALFLAEPGEWYVGGPLEGLSLPEHYDYRRLRHTPAQLGAEFARRGWSRIVAFQTRNPMHRSHFELTVRAVAGTEAALLIHPVVGATRPGDVDHFTRVRCYQAMLGRYPENTAMVSLLPLAMRLAGPREALWHALIRRNYGCTHFIVGRDHAGPVRSADGSAFYQPYQAQELVGGFEGEIGIEIVASEGLVYLADRDQYVEASAVPEGAEASSISGAELRRRVLSGSEIPEWFTFPEVAAELRRSTVPPAAGWAVLLTGLPSAGKSTVARHLVGQLGEAGWKNVVLLDGDLLRKTVSQGLGFSRGDREEHLRRVTRLAVDVVKQGGVAVCAVVAPYESAREEMRRMVQEFGRFLLVHVATPLDVCEGRDPKGLYRGARAGTVPFFTGVSDPYEVPAAPDLIVGAGGETPEQAAERIAGQFEGKVR